MTREEVKAARVTLGAMWKADRSPLTAKELARALGLSPNHGTDHIYNMERGKSAVSGPIEMLIRIYLAGGVPPDDVVIFNVGSTERRDPDAQEATEAGSS